LGEHGAGLARQPASALSQFQQTTGGPQAQKARRAVSLLATLSAAEPDKYQGTASAVPKDALKIVGL